MRFSLLMELFIFGDLTNTQLRFTWTFYNACSSSPICILDSKYSFLVVLCFVYECSFHLFLIISNLIISFSVKMLIHLIYDNYKQYACWYLEVRATMSAYAYFFSLILKHIGTAVTLHYPNTYKAFGIAGVLGNSEVPRKLRDRGALGTHCNTAKEKGLGKTHNSWWKCVCVWCDDIENDCKDQNCL